MNLLERLNFNDRRVHEQKIVRGFKWLHSYRTDSFYHCRRDNNTCLHGCFHVDDEGYAQPEHYLKARYFAQQKMEELSGLSYAGIGVPDTTYDYITTDPSCDITKPETCYKWKWKVTYMKPDFSADSGGDYKRISVTIQTRSPYNIEYTVDTIITKRPKES